MHLVHLYGSFRGVNKLKEDHIFNVRYMFIKGNKLNTIVFYFTIKKSDPAHLKYICILFIIYTVHRIIASYHCIYRNLLINAQTLPDAVSIIDIAQTSIA